MDDRRDLEEIVRSLKLVDDVRALAESLCAGCGARLCGHQTLVSIAFGFKDRPVCSACLAGRLGHTEQELLGKVVSYLAGQRCHRIAWAWANQNEGFDVSESFPPCIPLGSATQAAPAFQTPSGRSEPAAANMEWDAGDVACGDLLLELRRRLQSLAPAHVLKLVANDAGARQDIPAWCGLTGHRLLASEHPIYWIQRKES